MKSSRWVVCCVALLCLQFVGSEGDFAENNLNEEESHRTEKHDDLVRKLQDVQKAWENLKLAAKQGSDDNEIVADCKEKPKCIETGGECENPDTDHVDCKCPEGTTYNDDDGCKVDDNTCSTKLSKCPLTGGTCISTIQKKIACSCPTDTVWDKNDGCKVPNETCNTKSSKCLTTGGYCVSKDEAIECICPEGTTFDDENEETGCKVDENTCNTKLSKCPFSGGSCISNADRKIGCSCPDDTEWNNNDGCKVPEITCNTESPKCLNTGGYCISKDGSTKCICPEGTTLDTENEENGCKVDDSACSMELAKCPFTGGSCISTADRKIGCSCPYDTEWDKNDGCKVPNETCNTESPKCLITGGYCVSKSEAIECICPEGTTLDEETGCKVDEETCYTKLSECPFTGGSCTSTVDRKIGCSCPTDTKWEKDAGCEVPEDICIAKWKKCVFTGGYCISKNNDIQCICPEGTTFDKEGKEPTCKVLDEICREKKPNCLDTGGSCVSKTNAAVGCTCPTGTNYVNGVGCKVKKETCDKQFSKCLETEGTCVSHSNKTITCNCPTITEYEKGKGCKVPDGQCNTAHPKCLATGGICKAETEGTIDCVCPEKNQYVVEKGCIAANFCIEVCGANPGVKCTGDLTDKTKINCLCHNDSKAFEETSQECKDDKCLAVCGIRSGRANDALKCNGGPFGEVECECTDGKKSFDSTDRQCKTDFCKEICGDVECEGDRFNKTAVVCKCSGKYDDFVKKDKTCKVNYCKKVCGTDPGTECDDPYKAKEPKDCECYHSTKYFNPRIKKCQAQCSEEGAGPKCDNDGQCDAEGEFKFCDCVEGTTGDFCKNITECNESLKLCKGDRGKCVFKDETAKCECSNTKTEFYEKVGYCEVKCEEDKECVKVKICNGDNFCACPEGLEGDDCKVATGCKELEKTCKEQNAKCIYDENAEDKATCKCNNNKLSYDPKSKQCREQCSKKDDDDDDSNCQNEGKCVTRGNLNFCKCIQGTTGDFCQKITECDKTLKGCKGDKGKCIFQDKNPKCNCTKTNTEFYEVVGYCEDKCSEDKKCTGGRTCNDKEFCACPDGYEGKNCKDVTGCKELEKTCKDEDAKCVFDKDADDKATCKCNKKDFVYDPKDKKCKNPFCVTNPCQKPDQCSYDVDTKTGFCKCEEGQYFNYKSKKCEGLPNKCLLKKAACGKTEVCDEGKCVCAPGYVKEKEEDKECKPKLCDPNPCFPNADCNEKDGSCSCKDGTFFTGRRCEDAKCDWNNFKENCTCPDDMERKENSKNCVPSTTDKACDKSCGYGLCVKEDEKDVCKCFDAFATNVNGTCILKTEVCASGKTTKDFKKCDCSANQYTRAKDDITCRIITCTEASAKKDCDSKGATCKMRWKRDGTKNPGYYCECPPGYTEENGKCTDPCSQNKNIEECSKKDQFCYNSISGKNPLTGDCVCPPTLELKDGKCTKLAENTYIIRNIPVLKKRYEMKSGINKVLLNADIIESMTTMFTDDVYSYGYLSDYKLEDGVLKCSVWVNFKKAPGTELKRLKFQAKKFPKKFTCEDCDETITVWPPNLMLSGDKVDKISYDDLKFCKPEVKNAVCGIYADCKDNKCSCPKGFRTVEFTLRKEADFTLQRCEDIDECATNSHECSKNTTCVNVPGSYGCHCKPGFKKNVTDPTTDKSDCLDLCTPNPCKKGKCNLKEGIFDCECEPGVGGTYCHRPDTNYASAKKGTVIVGAILGTILCLAVIAFLLYYRKIRKSSGSEDFMPAPRMDNAEMTERRPMRGVVNKSYE